MYYTYILFSKVLNKYYVGYTSNLEERFNEHVKSKHSFTGLASDWEIIKYFEFESKTEAIKLESKIKKRGIKRFLSG